MFFGFSLRIPLRRKGALFVCIHFFPRTARVIAAALAVVVAPWGHAARAAGSTEVTRMEAVVTSASPRAQPVQDIQAAVQVIQQQDLQAYPGTNVTETLKQAVGVDAKTLGSNAGISLRGLSLSPGALLVDGMQRPGKYGSVNPSLLQLENVAQIEVVRGPMSALYGADATGGAINIVTRSPLRDEGVSGSVRLMGGATDGGQRHTRIAAATLGFGAQTLRHRISAERRQRGLFRYDNTSPGADLNRVAQTYASYEGALHITGDHSLRWTLESTVQNDTGPGLMAATMTRPAQAFTVFERERRWFGALHYDGLIGPGDLSLQLGSGRTNASTTRSYPAIETTHYRQSQGQIRYAFESGQHSVLVGGGFVHDDIEVSINPRKATRRNTYVLAQNEWRLPAQWKLLAGLRHDHFTDFGAVTTPRVSLQRTFGSWRVRAGYGRAYNAPGVLQQYASFLRGSILILGNPDLKPETNQSWEAALRYDATAYDAEIIYYRAHVKDMINTVNQARTPGDPASVLRRARYMNVARARLQGVEFSGAWRMGSGWSLLMGWETLDARDSASGARLTERARQIARAGLRREAGRLRVDVQTRHYVHYYATDPGRPGSAPFYSNYGTTDLKVRYQTGKQTSVAVGADNVFSRRQPVNFTARGSTFDPPARFVYLELRHGF